MGKADVTSLERLLEALNRRCSKPLDYAELERWTRVGYERGMRFRKGER
jgi:hypothetical protein